MSPTEVALMELREEIGGTANRLEYFGQFYTAYGIANVVAHIFIANGVSLGQTAQEPAEVMEIHINPLAEVLRMARTNQISDGPSALALLLCAEKLEGLSIQ